MSGNNQIQFLPNMISNDFILDFKKKQISHNQQGSETVYTLQELYSFIQDIFDEPKYMKYDIPIVANSKKEYTLINSWTITKDSLNYLKSGVLRLQTTHILYKNTDK